MINSFLLMDESILINIITVCAFLSINTINFFLFQIKFIFYIIVLDNLVNCQELKYSSLIQSNKIENKINFIIIIFNVDGKKIINLK